MDLIPSVFLHGIQKSGSQSKYFLVSQDSVFFDPRALQKFEHCDFLMPFIIAINISPNNTKSLRYYFCSSS